MLKISKIREVRDQKNVFLLLDHRKKQFPGGVVGGLGVATFSHLRHVVPPLKIPCLAPVIPIHHCECNLQGAFTKSDNAFQGRYNQFRSL